MDESMKTAIESVGAQVDAASKASGGSDKPANPDEAGDIASGMEMEPTPEKVYQDMAADPDKGPVLKEMEAVAGGKDVIMAMLKNMHEPGDDMKATMGKRIDDYKEKPAKDDMGMASIFAGPAIKKAGK